MDERLLVIPDAVLFTYVKDKEDRTFFVYGDIHQSRSNMCENLSVKDNIEVLAESYPEVMFDFFLEGGGPAEFLDEARYHDLQPSLEGHPMTKIREYFHNCLSGGCPENVKHRWLEFRYRLHDALRLGITNILKKGPQVSELVLEGKFLSRLIHTFVRNPDDGYMKYLLTSIKDFALRSPNKYRMALLACEASVLESVKYGLNRENIDSSIIELLQERPEIYAEEYVHSLFDLNFISRIEHVHKDRGEAPQNIFFYGGLRHSTTLLFYLGMLGVKERYDVGEGLRDYLAFKHQDLYQRCHRLEYSLLDLFQGNFPLKDNVEEEFRFLEESPDKYEAIVRLLTMNGGAAVLFQPLLKYTMSWKTETVEKIVEKARKMLEV